MTIPILLSLSDKRNLAKVQPCKFDLKMCFCVEDQSMFVTSYTNYKIIHGMFILMAK